MCVESAHLNVTRGTTYTFVPETSFGSVACDFIHNNTQRRQCLLVTDGLVERDSVIHLKESRWFDTWKDVLCLAVGRAFIHSRPDLPPLFLQKHCQNHSGPWVSWSLETGRTTSNRYLWGQRCPTEEGVVQCFSTFVRPRPGKLFFYKTRVRSQQIYS
jgi:hypothetical protein